MKTMMPELASFSPVSVRRCVLLCLVFVSLAGCDRSGKRLKENPPPNPLVQKRPEVVQGHLLAGSKAALLRSAQLGPADAANILKGFTYKANAEYRFKRNTKILTLKEDVVLEQSPDGEYHLTVNNSQNKGYEVLWVNKVLFQRMRYRPFRVTSHNVEDAFRWQQRSFGRWRSVVGLFGAQLALSQMGSSQWMGRDCHRYQIALHREPQPPLKLKEGTAWKGTVPDHTRGAAAKKKRTPLAAQGELWVDSASGLPLKVSFQGRYRIGTSKDAAVASIRLKASFTARKDAPLAPPQKVVQVKRETDAHDAFGQKKPAFMLPPPSSDDADKGQRRRRKKRRRKRRR